MEVLHAFVGADVLIKRVEHLRLKAVVMGFNLIERDTALFSDLVN